MGIFSSCQHLCLRSSVKKQREVTGDTDDCKNCLGFFFSAGGEEFAGFER